MSLSQVSIKSEAEADADASLISVLSRNADRVMNYFVHVSLFVQHARSSSCRCSAKRYVFRLVKSEHQQNISQTCSEAVVKFQDVLILLSLLSIKGKLTCHLSIQC